MHFGRRNVGYNYHLDTKSLDEVSEEKDLGVTIICDLKASLKSARWCLMVTEIAVQQKLPNKEELRSTH